MLGLSSRVYVILVARSIISTRRQLRVKSCWQQHTEHGSGGGGCDNVPVKKKGKRNWKIGKLLTVVVCEANRYILTCRHGMLFTLPMRENNNNPHFQYFQMSDVIRCNLSSAMILYLNCWLRFPLWFPVVLLRFLCNHKLSKRSCTNMGKVNIAHRGRALSVSVYISNFCSLKPGYNNTNAVCDIAIFQI